MKGPCQLDEAIGRRLLTVQRHKVVVVEELGDLEAQAVLGVGVAPEAYGPDGLPDLLDQRDGLGGEVTLLLLRQVAARCSFLRQDTKERGLLIGQPHGVGRAARPDVARQGHEVRDQGSPVSRLSRNCRSLRMKSARSRMSRSSSTQSSTVSGVTAAIPRSWNTASTRRCRSSSLGSSSLSDTSAPRTSCALYTASASVRCQPTPK